MSYQALREKIITLNIEVEDRQKLCDALTSKIEDERKSIVSIEKNIEIEFQHLIEIESESWKEENCKILKTIEEHIEEKKKIIQQCKDLVDNIKIIDEETEANLRKLMSQSDEILENEKSNFKRGQEERLRKYISAKVVENKSSTELALAPEFARIKHQNDSNLNDLELKYTIDERKLKQEIENKLLLAIEEEKERFKKEQMNNIRQKTENINKEYEDLEKKHKRSLLNLTDELERDIDKLKDSLNKKTEKNRIMRQKELAEAAKYSKENIEQLRRNHEIDMDNLRAHHDKQISDLLNSFILKKDSIQIEFLNKQKEDIFKISSSQNEFLLNFRKTNELERDRKIQAEIRLTQAENIRIEREGFNKFFFWGYKYIYNYHLFFSSS
jgi:hypothetical protein